MNEEVQLPTTTNVMTEQDKSRCAPAPGSEKCGNCGEPAQAWCIVAAGRDRMPGWLCGRCIRKHKAEVVFPNAAPEPRGK